MLHFRRIVVPTDFSDHSDHALRYAANLAQQVGATLILLHVISNETLEGISKAHVPPYPVDKVYEDLTLEIRQQYQTHVAPDVRRSLETEILVLPGVPFLEIIRAARVKEADLIVMATHGRTGLSHALLGSVTEKVVRKSPCPVLSIRPVGVEVEAAKAA